MSLKSIVSKIKPSISFTQKQYVFALFIGVSTFFWFMTNLSKEYETIIPFQVSYTNLPKSKLFQTTPNSIVQLRVKGSGFQLLKEQMSSNQLSIDLKSVRKKQKYRYFLKTITNQRGIETQMNRAVQLVSFVKDTLFFDLGKNIFRKVPVVTNFKMKFKPGYNFSKRFQISPDSITINGPESRVAAIRSVATLPYNQDQISKDIAVSVGLLLPENLQGVHYSETAIQLKASVEKFTEDSFVVPFTINGLPENTAIMTYPKTVEVVFQVGMSSYKQITANDFKIVCDYERSQKDKIAYLRPEVVKKPARVSSVRIIPNTIEYLIQK